MEKSVVKKICRRCLLNSYTIKEVLFNHLQKSGQQEITSIKLGKESHIHWRDQFHKIPLYFRIGANFEANIEIVDGKVVANKTTNIYKQNPVLNGSYIMSELGSVLTSG